MVLDVACGDIVVSVEGDKHCLTAFSIPNATAMAIFRLRLRQLSLF